MHVNYHLFVNSIIKCILLPPWSLDIRVLTIHFAVLSDYFTVYTKKVQIDTNLKHTEAIRNLFLDESIEAQIVCRVGERQIEHERKRAQSKDEIRICVLHVFMCG